jgi:hypothetical protein
MDYGVAASQVPIGGGGTLPPNHKKYRIRVLETFLKAGVPLVKIDDFRSLLEEFSPYSLTSASHMTTYIPGVLEAMRAMTMKLIESHPVVILFDGTPHLGELISVIVRFFSHGRIRQRLIYLVHLDKSPDALELYRVRSIF